MMDGYRPSDFPPFAVTVDVVLLTVKDGQLQVLLVQRGNEPYKDGWALPGGFVGPDEPLDDAARRELAEETGVGDLPDGFYLEQLRTYGTPGRDPRMRVVSVAYVALIPPPGSAPQGGSDATQARWWPVADLALGLFDGEAGEVALAFDHADVVRDGVERARAKLEYATVATRFVNEPFTIPELRRVYETVWGVRLHPDNFRRKVLAVDGFVAGQSGGTAVTGGRPARLYVAGDVTAVRPPFDRP